MDQTLVELIKALGYPLGTVITLGLGFYIWRQFFDKTLESMVNKDLENLRLHNQKELAELQNKHSEFLEEKKNQLAFLYDQKKIELQEAKWPAELARELQKTRGVERQDLRYKSYGALWKELRPLAIYDSTPITKSRVSKLSSKLSDWYFSESGGLLLTPQSRDFYFALQDLLRMTSRMKESWDIERFEESAGTQQNTLRAVLKLISTDEASRKLASEASSILDYFTRGDFKDWHDVAVQYGAAWKDCMKKIAANWKTLDEKQRFATLQQAGSILRTSLATDLESRLG